MRLQYKGKHRPYHSWQLVFRNPADFVKSWDIAFPLHSMKLKSFCWVIWFIRFLGGFHEIHMTSAWNLPDFMKSARFIKSTWNPPDFMKSAWNLPDFVKSTWNLLDFVKSTWNLPDFMKSAWNLPDSWNMPDFMKSTWNPPDFMISAWNPPDFKIMSFWVITKHRKQAEFAPTITGDFTIKDHLSGCPLDNFDAKLKMFKCDGWPVRQTNSYHSSWFETQMTHATDQPAFIIKYILIEIKIINFTCLQLLKCIWSTSDEYLIKKQWARSLIDYLGSFFTRISHLQSTDNANHQVILSN